MTIEKVETEINKKIIELYETEFRKGSSGEKVRKASIESYRDALRIFKECTESGEAVNECP